ncbi:hypothetical protein C1878_04890 [Gordonibacter sp. 28C]|uniref:helix-turn-helix transcriptional regulator n=1 Tax=Gordonibacter sp. 28C TaxID=2078569 RepID=UPI000DF7273E|nr:LuxR C-terminal-related transcriptional regulator [Gordonibacter sp. 28C]RDB63205.1 hypothetical protein C1878_04890 [Gordonibacter sp. 28C]
MTDAAPLERDASERRVAKLASIARATLPVTIGLALANTCFNVAVNESALSLSGPLASNGPVFAAVAAMALCMLLLARRSEHLRSSTVRLGAVWCIVAQALAAVALGLLEAALVDVTAARLVAVTVLEAASLGALGFWLRGARGLSAAAAAVVVFGAVIVSEPLICAAAFLPSGATYALLAAVGGAQALCLHRLQRRPPDQEALRLALPRMRRGGEGQADSDTGSTGYFGLARSMADDKRLLIVTAVGIWILALAKAVIRVFPLGVPIPYTPATLGVYFVLTIIVAAVLLYVALDENSDVMTAGIWLVMQNLAVLALLACSFFPGNLDIGLSFTYVLDVLLLAYTWYVALAFMNFGQRDPYYYVGGGLIAFLLPRALTNVGMPILLGAINQAAATTAIAAALLLLCAQFLFLRLPHLRAPAPRPEDRERSLSHAVQRAFGLEEPADTSTAMRLAIMQSHASRMQEQFLLSDREAEVLALYALGHTQDKIAGELLLSPGTVHTYVMRIYSKTDLHSRQAILNYIERYVG